MAGRKKKKAVMRGSTSIQVQHKLPSCLRDKLSSRCTLLPAQTGARGKHLHPGLAFVHVQATACLQGQDSRVFKP